MAAELRVRRAARRRKAECAYCGEVGPVTVDHVPPKSIYGDARPADPPRVDACFDCNNGASNDDEYFVHTILKDERVAVQEIARPQLTKLFSALRNPAKAGYATATFKALTHVELYSEAGIYLGRRPAVRVDNLRMQRAATRYIRGLFRHETGKRLPPATELRVFTDPAAAERFGSALMTLFQRHGITRQVQSGVFSYHYATHPTNPDESMWLLLFFDAYPVVGRVGALLSAQ